MILAETLFIGGVPQGRINFDAGRKLATFVPHHDHLKPLARLEWSCPVECREAVKAFVNEFTEKVGNS